MAELRYTYLLDVKDMASRQVAQANARVTKSVEQTNVAMRQQGTVAESAARKVQSAGARQAAEWRQVQRAAQAAERSVAQSATQASAAVTRAVERQVRAQRTAGQSYAAIARQQKAAGVSARETATAIEQSAAKERAAMEKTATTAHSAGGKIGVGLKGQIKSFTGLAAGLGATFAAFKGFSFIKDAVQETESLARSTIKLQTVTGQDAKTASEWIVIAKERGLSTQQLAKGFQTLERNQTKGLAGTKASADAFRALGISQRQLKGLGTEKLVERVSDAFRTMKNPAERATIAQQLFGRGGIALLPILARGGKAIRDLRKEIDASGASMDRNGVKKALQLVAAQRRLDAQMLGLKITLGLALIPLLTKGARALSNLIDGMRKGTGVGGQIRRVFEQMAQGAKDVWSAIGPAVTAIGRFVKANPAIAKVAGGIVAIGVALRTLKFAGAISGVTTLVTMLGRLRKLGGGAGGAAGGGGISAAGLGVSAATVSRVGLLVVASLAARQELQKLTKEANKSHSGVSNLLGKVGEFVNTVGWKPIDAAASRLKKTFDQLAGIAPKLAATSRQTTERLQAVLGRTAGKNIAQTFTTEVASAGHATKGMVDRVVAQLARLKGDARLEARKAMKAMLDQMVASGQITKAAAAKVEKNIAGAFGPLKDDLGSAARRGIRAITREFGALPGGITNPLRLSLQQTRSYMGRIIDTVNLTVRQLRTMRALLAAGIEPTSPRSIGGGHRPATGRGGGILHRGAFRRYQQGGLVPAMLSPGEMVVHGGAGMMVPGQRTAADTVPMLLPTGSAVLTGDGQARMAAGASVAQAVASQAPHFAAGGWVRTGATVFSDPPPGAFGSLRGGYAELGTATRGGGATGSGYLARALGRRGELPAHYPLEVKIHGRSRVLRKQDRGYGQGTPSYGIDIWRDSWPFFGIDSSFKGPALIRPADGSKATGSGPGSSYAVSGLRQAMSRRIGRSATRAGLVDDAFGAGFAQGEQGLTRARLRYTTDAAYRDIAGAYRLPASKTAGGTGGGGKGGGGGGKDPGYYQRVKNLVGLGNFDGYRVAKWIIPALRYSRAHGGRFQVTSGYRSHATNVAHGRNYHSLHEDVKFPGGAVDFGGMRDRAAFQRRASFLRHLAGYRGPRPKPLYGDDGHVSGTGHRRGGWIGAPVRLRAGTGNAGGPVQVGRVTHQETTGPGIPAFGKHLQDAVARALTWQAGTLDRLNTTIQAAAERKLGQLRNRLQAAVRKGGTEAAVKRLQAALDLVDKELGRRAGLLARRITQRAAAADRSQARGEIGLRLAGIDPENPQGLAARLRVEAAKGKGLHRTGRDLEGELRLARRAHDLDRITDLKTQIADNQTAILESRASQRELARARQQALLDARTTFAAALTDIATSRVQLSQTGLQRVELEQRLAGTYDTGGRARADYITNQVIPQLQSERDQIRAQGVEAMRQNNADLARQLRQAWEEKGNDILQALLDVKDASETTAANTDPLKQLGGQLAFEFGGSRLTDDLLSSGVGA